MIAIADVKDRIEKIAQGVIQNQAKLEDLDKKSGDGDLGMSMVAAFNAILESVRSFDGNDIGAMLLKSALACNKAAPSTMGTLLSSGMVAIAKAWKGKDRLTEEEVVLVPRLFTEAIIARGKAKQGDKTILDALFPLCDAVEKTYAETQDLQRSFAAGAEAAEQGAEATRGMRAAIGRAKWLGERAAVHPDAGAVLGAIMARAALV